MTISEFIAKWRQVELKERSAAQEHFIDLCRLFEHPTPAAADPTGETFCFEKGAAKHGGGDGFADVWKRGFFGWEYKGRHKDLNAAYDQLLRYRDALDVSAGSVMRTRLTTIPEDQSCRTAMQILLETGLAALPVVNSERRLMGILSKTDLMLPSAIDKSVADVYTRETLTIQAHWPLRRVIRILHSKRVRCLPVVDAQGILVGVVGRRDILAYYQENL